MNEKTLNAEEIVTLFEMFMDELSKGAISYEDYLVKFRETIRAGENSPMEWIFRGFIGGLYIAAMSDGVPSSEV